MYYQFIDLVLQSYVLHCMLKVNVPATGQTNPWL